MLWRKGVAVFLGKDGRFLFLRVYSMSHRVKRFISPGGWFAMYYPQEWNEVDGGEGTFLFYNPEQWNGNFRISAYRDGQSDYGAKFVEQELADNPTAVRRRVGKWMCAYSCEEFVENGQQYDSHFWLLDGGDTGIECSFTVLHGTPGEVGAAIVASIEVRPIGSKVPAEVIPLRLSEMYAIEEACDHVTLLLKKKLSANLQVGEGDLENLQRLVESQTLSAKKREHWMALGIVLCAIFANEVEGVEWCTLVDGNREVPVLQCPSTRLVADPMKLFWSKVRNGEPCNVFDAYDRLSDILPGKTTFEEE